MKGVRLPPVVWVGLAGRERDLVRTYSLGMRQRLGLAAALIKDPALLILDEPANGLDPAGIVEIRELVRSIGAEGRTVFVSSHLLGEVQQMSDRVAILARGKLITQGPVDEVLAQGNRGALVVSTSSSAPRRCCAPRDSMPPSSTTPFTSRPRPTMRRK
jgi:ABC-2 type transport system ATP-binding protein